MGLLDSLLGSKSSADQEQLFFASDLHGSTTCFKKFVNAAEFYDVDTLILGGDWTGKAFVPIVDEGDRWRIEHPNQTKYADSEAEVEEIEDQVVSAGYYPRRVTSDEYEELRSDDAVVEERARELELERIDQWVEWADEKLGDTDTDVYAIAGNDDREYVIDRLAESSVIEMVDSGVTTMPSGHELLGYGWSNPTPWDTPREHSEEDIAADLEELAAEIDDWSRTILNVHVPPYDTGIDEAPKLDDQLRPVTSGGQVEEEPVGSHAIREFVEEHQPLLGLFGHIHESQGKFSLGRTTCVNPGSEYGEGILNGILLTLEDDSITQHQFTSG